MAYSAIAPIPVRSNSAAATGAGGRLHSRLQWAMWKFPHVRGHIDQSATISYTSTHFIAMRKTHEGFKPKLMEEQNIFLPE